MSSPCTHRRHYLRTLSHRGPLLLGVFTLAALVLMTGPARPAQDHGTQGTESGGWSTRAAAPTKRTEVAAAAVNAKVYVVGGFSEPSFGNLKDLAITPIVEEYDPVRDHWVIKAPLPAGLHHAGIAALGGQLYVVGGFSKALFSVWHPVASLYAYDAVKDVWTERQSMPTARGALAVAVVDGKLLAIGGSDGSQNTGAVEEYDPRTDQWTAKATLPTPRDHLAAAVVNGKVYAIGGRLKGDYGRNLSVTEVYDPAADRWTAAADLPTARSGITAAVLNETIYVLGGESPAGTFATNEAYQPAQDRWRTAPSMPTARHGLGSAVVDGRLYVIAGGPKPGGSFGNVNEMFVPAATRSAQPAKRASRKQIAAVMAMLATFEDAGVLPPESSQDANRLIRALIQFQSAFSGSGSQALQRVLTDAMTAKLGDAAPAVIARFPTVGWTSESLEALVEYANRVQIWDEADIRDGFRPYNVGQADFHILATTFSTARSRLAEQGRDVHGVFATRRREMPGAES